MPNGENPDVHWSVIEVGPIPRPARDNRTSPPYDSGLNLGDKKVAQTNSRLEQFQKMAHDDPSNEVAHFSLGREYLAAGRNDETRSRSA